MKDKTDITGLKTLERIMKLSRLKTAWSVCLILITVFAFGLGMALLKTDNVYADEGAAGHNESYRNKISYSAARGWNNDPNGLLYVNGTYHMYYQYNYDKNTGNNENHWGHMSWGHATSTDLVHWTEKSVALPEGTVGDDGKTYAMMFSGSAVYDENNTSGLFDIDPTTGKVAANQGIVAVLTQPDDSVGGQRQILAYSKDGGDSFSVYGEIIGAKQDGNVGDGEFRDPKVFWNEALGKWLMAVGGGSVRMYSSDNLKDWSYIGQTGYWGECPDISRFTVDGEDKYVLIISPEDKAKSHEYNKTTRAETYYPAEYYVVGDINEQGLFVSNEPVRRLSEGIDSYAFQSFNNAPDGKVYGVSWSASWKSVGEYEGFRQNYNGGMTVVCELNLTKENGAYVLTRKPVEGYGNLRGETLKEFTGKLNAGNNALAGVRADTAHIQAELDFSDGAATYAELNLRVSAAERITLRYDVSSETLTLDRSNSSLLAAKTALYAVPYGKVVPLSDGKLSLEVLLDRAFISVFANGGRASYFSAVFPSAISNAMQLISDGDIGVNVKVSSLNGIFGETDSVDDLIVTTDKIDATVGNTYAVIASSYSADFKNKQVTFQVTEGSGNVKLDYINGTAYIRAIKKGYAKISVTYGTVIRTIDVYVYNDGFVSDVNYGFGQGGFSYISDDGLNFSVGTSDAFLFSKTAGDNIIYSAEFTPKRDGSQAGGLMFGISDNLTDYCVATVDVKDNKVKLWRSGIGDLKTADYNFGNPSGVKLTLTVNGGLAKIYVGDDKTAALVYKLSDYSGGAVGLNVYNAEMTVNNVTFNRIDKDGEFDFGSSAIVKVVNVTDGSYRLQSKDYSVEKGRFKISPEYLSTLENDKEYTFRVVTDLTDFDVTIKTDFAPSSVFTMKDGYSRSEALTLGISEGVEVYGVEIDGKKCDGVTFENGVITVAAENLSALMSGAHTVKAYTSKGRPQAEFSIVAGSDFRDADIEAVSYTFLYIDIAIFAAIAIGYAVFSIIAKRKAK